MENNNVQYKWNKLVASKRFNSKYGSVKLTVLEQQELLDDISKLRDYEQPKP